MTPGPGLQAQAKTRLYLDKCPGERRGVLQIEGRPHVLLIERDGESRLALGARYRGRVIAVSAGLGLARVDLGGPTASLKLAGLGGVAEGALIEVDITAEPGRGKDAFVVCTARPAQGPLGLISAAPSLEAQLQLLAPDAPLETGDAARDAADEAQQAALQTLHDLGGGVSLAIEPTRALIAVDVDLAEEGGVRAPLKANLLAIREAARLLRLKALCGLVVIDLVGFPNEKGRIHEAALAAFTLDGADVTIGPLSRFGALELTKPRRYTPLAERLCDATGALSARTLAQDLVRDLMRQARYNAGVRLAAVCAPEIAEVLRPLVAALGPMFQVRETVGLSRSGAHILPL